MKHLITSEKSRYEFAEQVKEISGQKLSLCYQCGKCSAGCPIAFAMDYLPNQIVRFAQLGMVDKLMESSTIWLCASCQTCSARCPRGIDLARIMDALRILAKQKEAIPKDQIAPVFDAIFLGIIEKYGRLHEMELITKLNVASGRLFKDIFLFPKMLRKGKIKLMPKKVKPRGQIKKIIRKIEKLKSEREK